MLKDLILKNRSFRRFHQEPQIDLETLKELIDLARLTPSAANKQPLKYILSADQHKNDTIFRRLAWAGYLADWSGPANHEKPTAYIIILSDNEISPSVDCDHGIAAQTILLGAVEKGLGGCMVGSIQREELRQDLQIPDRYSILLVLALGKPAETVVIEPTSDNIEYWRCQEDIHHVPKRPLDEIIIE